MAFDRRRRATLDNDQVLLSQILFAWPEAPNRAMNWPMRDLLNLIRWMLLGLFRSRTWFEAENLALRHQLNVLHRRSPRRPVFSNFDRVIFVCLYRIAPRILESSSG